MRRPSVIWWLVFLITLFAFDGSRGFVLAVMIAGIVAVFERRIIREWLLQRKPPVNAAVLITGCSSGFGKKFAHDLARQGLTVLAGVRTVADGVRLVREAGDWQGRIIPVILDVTKPEHIERSVRFVRRCLALGRRPPPRRKQELLRTAATSSAAGSGEQLPHDSALGVALDSSPSSDRAISISDAASGDEKKLLSAAGAEDDERETLTADESSSDSDKLQLFAVINNAGIQVIDPLETVDAARFRQNFEVNVFGAMAVTQAYLPLLRRCSLPGGARIVFIGSFAGLTAFPYMGTYCATKHAVEALCDSLRQELRGSGVRVSLIQPGLVNTDIMAAYDRHNRAPPPLLNNSTPEVSERYANELRNLAGFITRNRASMPGPSLVSKQLQRILYARYPPARAVVGIDASAGIFFANCLPDTLLDIIWRTPQFLAGD